MSGSFFESEESLLIKLFELCNINSEKFVAKLKTHSVASWDAVYTCK